MSIDWLISHYSLFAISVSVVSKLWLLYDSPQLLLVLFSLGVHVYFLNILFLLLPARSDISYIPSSSCSKCAIMFWVLHQVGISFTCRHIYMDSLFNVFPPLTGKMPASTSYLTFFVFLPMLLVCCFRLCLSNDLSRPRPILPARTILPPQYN